MPSDMNISLEQHLRDTLSTLAPVLPANITLDLTAPTVPYSELQEISKWSRTEEGQKAAKGVDCSMIALLAGSTTSPERRFAPVEKRVDDSKRELNDRKAVVAVVNSLLSIGGSGMASWWAAGVIGWRDEWKVLFALFVAAVVAIAEGVLFVIWDSRTIKKSKLNGRHKKVDRARKGVLTEIAAVDQRLRQRK